MNTSEMTMNTDRLTVRPIEEADWRTVQKIWQDFSRSKYVYYDQPKNTDDGDVRQRIARWEAATRSGKEHIFFAACLEDRMIGYFSLNICPEGYELGYGFLDEYQGKGYAKESLTAILEFMRKNGAKKITAGTALENLPSAALLRSAGFQLAGTEKVSFYKDITFDGGCFEKEL